MHRDEVILVNEMDEPQGTMEKIEAHRKALLHRAFSVFIFNQKGEMLLQQRSRYKYHSAGLWTNACCSHPRPGEDTHAAAVRRLQEELGFTTALEKCFAFTYRSEFENGLTEYEFDHVFTGVYDQAIRPNGEEVSDYCFQTLDEIRAGLQSHPGKYTSWFHLAFPLISEKRMANQ
jgi:isopentenyl-diphosphate delta-isomerase